ncbi:MAG: phosphoribosylglycinamide formyltransferase [Desulfobacterales bacterium]|nr:phosphoribosylglycinamide formyltransferase [Desulfobacterales bacterium]
MDRKIRIGALISGGGTNLLAIMDACESGGIHGRMVFVGSDRPDAAGLDRARTRNIPTFTVDYRRIIDDYRVAPEAVLPPDDFDLEEILAKQSLFAPEADPGRVNRFFLTRAVAEARLMAAMAATPFDLLVLAGFMRNLTPYFIDRINTAALKPRIMNIHPALLPAFPGTDGYGDTFRYGCKVGGCTVHFVDYGEDSGPIIGQRTVAVVPGETLDAFRKKGLAAEWRLYPECIQLFAQGRLQLVPRTRTLADGEIINRWIVEILPQ